MEETNYFFKRLNDLNHPKSQSLSLELQLLQSYILKQLDCNAEITKLDIEHLENKNMYLQGKLTEKLANYNDKKTHFESILFTLGVDMERVQLEIKSAITLDQQTIVNFQSDCTLLMQERQLVIKEQEQLTKDTIDIGNISLQQDIKDKETQLNEWILKKNRIRFEIKEWEMRYTEESMAFDTKIAELQELNATLTKLKENQTTSITQLTPIYTKILFETEERSKLEFKEKVTNLSQTIAAKKIQRVWKHYKSTKKSKGSLKKKKKK